MCELSSLCSFSPDELTVYKVQNLQWTADFSGDVTLTWTRPKKMPSASCVYNVYYRWVLPREGAGPPRLRGPGSLGQKAAPCCAGKGSVLGWTSHRPARATCLYSVGQGGGGEPLEDPGDPQQQNQHEAQSPEAGHHVPGEGAGAVPEQGAQHQRRADSADPRGA